MIRKIRAYVEQHGMLAKGDTVVAGVSGGADSVCLFLVLRELQKDIPFQLYVVHVNHGIRAEAGQDAAFVERLCGEHGIPFFLVERDVQVLAGQQGLSTEEVGRQVRYEAFSRVLERVTPGTGAQGRGRIAVAHNANDQAETMLFHLFRGSGLTGLGGMRPVRGQVIRPLLCMERREIEEFLAEKGVSYCIDKTNAEDTYTRNRIRHHILPYAEREISGGAVAHLNRTAGFLQETEDFVKEATDRAYDSCVAGCRGVQGQEQWVINVTEAGKLHSLLRGQLVRRVLENCIGGLRDVTARHVDSVRRLLEGTANGQVSLPGGLEVRREYERLLFEKVLPGEKERGEDARWTINPAPSCQVEVPGLGLLEFSLMSVRDLEKEFDYKANEQFTKCFDYDKIKESLTLRNRETGDYLTVDQTLSRKSLQDYMINEKIPRQQRDSVWLLADGQHVLWVVGYRISQAYKVNEKTEKILRVQLRGGHEDGGAH